MIYASPDGVQVLHILTAWSSPEVANQQLQPFSEELQSQGFELQKEIRLRNDEGQEVGTAQILAGKEGEEVIVWTDDVLFCVVDTPKGYSVDFFGDLPY